MRSWPMNIAELSLDGARQKYRHVKRTVYVSTNKSFLK